MSIIVKNESPRVVLVEEFLTQEEVDHLVLMATPHLKRSEVIDPKSGQGLTVDYRTGFNHCFTKGQDLIIKDVEKKIADACAVRVEQLEYIQVNKYAVGDEFKPHQDWLDEKTEGHAKRMAQGGQRTISCIVYLKEPEEGGETLFEALNLKIKPVARAALLWYNVNAKVEPDHRVMHAGLPVKKGEKWIVTCWVRERAFDGSEEAAHKEKLAKAIETEEALKKKLAEMRLKNIEDGHAEIMEICRRRKLMLYPYPLVERNEKSGGFELGAALDLVPDMEARR